MNPIVQNLLMKIKDPNERLDAMEKYDERAGVCEFDGKMSRMDAEAAALAELKVKVSHESK